MISHQIIKIDAQLLASKHRGYLKETLSAPVVPTSHTNMSFNAEAK